MNGAVLVASRPFDLSDAPFDAFVERHHRFVDLLTEHFTVSLLGLRPPGDTSHFAKRWSGLSSLEVTIGGARQSRRHRAIDALAVGRNGTLADWEVELASVAASLEPDAVVTLGPWLHREYRALHALRPSVHLFEEDLTRMHELAPQSPQARALRTLQVRLEARSRRQPAAVGYISRREEAAARQRYPRAKAVYLPYTLDPVMWPLAGSPSQGTGAVAVGNMSEFRNAEGLAQLMALVAGKPEHPLWGTRVVSDKGLHPSLQPFVSTGQLMHAFGQDPATSYRQAAIAIVPALRATGLKTTVLQAWTTGCPVVGFTACAESVRADATSMRFADTAPELLDHIEQLFNQPADRDALAYGGFAMLRDHYDDARNQAAFLSVVRHAISTGDHVSASTRV